MTTPSKRAENVAWAALVAGIIFFVVTFLIGRWSGFLAISSVAWMLLSSVIIWFVLSIQFHQRSLSEQEKLDANEILATDRTSTIFETDGQQSTLLAVATRRLNTLEKYFLPIFAALAALYQVGVGLYVINILRHNLPQQTKEPLVCAVSMAAVAFIGFLFSRYATGMSSSRPEWKPLRAGASSLLAVSVICFLSAAALALANFSIFFLINILNWAVPVLLVVLGTETALNIIFDIYRPRIKGVYSRAGFDSRLLGVINEPGGIFHTAATAIDYQFGFKVSETWFYKLLEKAVVPLVLFAILALYLLSCVVIINPNEQAIVEHFGSPHGSDGKVRLLGPGLSFKWPWPIDVARKYPTNQVAEIAIGYMPKIDPRTGEEVREPLLWGKSHYEHEYMLLVASSSGRNLAAAVPVSLVVATVPVQYRIKDLYSFVYNHNEPVKLLESICYQQLTEFAAGAKIEVDDSEGLSKSLLGAGRAEAEKALTGKIQAAVDKAGLGIEVVFLGLQGIHPPPEVASAYQAVVGSVQKKYASILSAQAQRNGILSALAGSVEQVEQLQGLAAKYQQAREKGDIQETEKLGRELDEALEQAQGDIFRTIREARSYAFENATLAEATGKRFANQLEAYKAARDIYCQNQRLAVLEDSLEKIRKFVVADDHNDKQVFIVDYTQKSAVKPRPAVNALYSGTVNIKNYIKGRFRTEDYQKDRHGPV